MRQGDDDRADGPDDRAPDDGSDGVGAGGHLPDDLGLDPADDGLDSADDDAPRTPLPPDDRLWRHPSEVRTAGLPSAAAPPPPRRSPKRRPSPAPSARGSHRVVAVLSGAVYAMLTIGMLVATGRVSREGAVQPPAAAPQSVVTVGSTTPAGVAGLVAKVQPSVFGVQADRAGMPPTRGSAVVVRPGYAVTALHVVDGAATVAVQADGVRHAARVIGSDPETDLALLAFDGVATAAPPMGASSSLRPGDLAVTVSAPPSSAGAHSVMVGVVSALDRNITSGSTMVRGVLQLDRPVPPEGAGGALLDSSGNVVGVTLPAADAGTWFGYAVPIDAVNDVSRQLLQSGHVSRPWLGIDGGDDVGGSGANVLQVKPGSPAARAGVQVGDVVTAVDGTPVRTMDGMLRLLRTHVPGDTVRLSVLRKGKPVQLQVTLAPK